MYYISPKFLLIAMAIFFLAMILPALFSPKTFKEVLSKRVKNSETVRLSGLWVLLVWFIYLSNYWKIDATWNLLVSLTGWAMVLKWIVWMRYPGYLAWKFKTLRGTKWMAYIISIVCVILAAFYIRAACVKF